MTCDITGSTRAGQVRQTRVRIVARTCPTLRT